MKLITPTQKGVITSAVMILASLFSLYILKNPVEGSFQLVIYLLFCGGIIWSILTYSISDTPKKTFNNYFSIGFKTFVVVSLLMAVFTGIYFYLNPEINNNSIAENSRLLLKEGNHLPKEIEENAKELKKWFLPLMISLAIFKYLFIGAFVSLVAAGILGKKYTTPIS